MDYAYALLPVAVVIFALLLARTPVWAAAALGVAVALVQLGLHGGSAAPVEWDKGVDLLLTASLVVVPELALNAVLKQRHLHEQLADWVHAIPLSAPWKTCLVVLGIGPALESLTGFGVSQQHRRIGRQTPVEISRQPEIEVATLRERPHH